MSNKAPFSFVLVIGLMLFALFFGAGNLIFPPMLGQSAGTNFWEANLGFLVTGVGLPLMTVLAFGFSGKTDLLELVKRVHPVFGLIFSIILYLTLGPLFALPRSGTVSFEIGVTPFLPEDHGPLPLAIFTILFFSLTCVLALNPTKIVDVIGKVLTPLKLTFIGLLVLIAVIKPISPIQAPVKAYESHVFFKGFQNGYLTMDTLAAFVFGIIIINAMKEKGITSKKQIMITCAKATVIAAVILAVLYTALAYMGASSVGELGYFENGGLILSNVSQYYFGFYGQILLGLMITVACLTTSVGLMTSCSSFFNKLYPKLSYKSFVVILSVLSIAISNVGLTNLITISGPVLKIIYPVAIVLAFLTFLHPVFFGKSEVYQVSLFFTLVVSVCGGLSVKSIDDVLSPILPLYSDGLGWVLPALVGMLIGGVIGFLRNAGGSSVPHK
ncbi:branched-chain amino acid transport system II carrier protein [Priestia koreensis]|uniref:branched-chain amino acid transport system II carrier protein n=1 Tax=Priestia koreensis TaxID=284581 RepID=UPI0028F71207|nr:branched-chain amino acid transport system II carrier protein [Priestia koreensis]